MTLPLYGTDEPPASWRTIQAGRLSFELEDGAIRHVRADGVEVLRGVAFLVRDAAWGTVPASLDELSIEQHGDTASVSFRATATLPAGAITWRAVVVADANGLAFHVQGESLTRLTVNRVGFVVLHPLEGVAGCDVVVEHVDGTRETVPMPLGIAPDQPAFDVAALTHAPVPGCLARVELFGETFEVEDQRNWTDASFKTYARPLDRPRPFELPAGSPIVQSVRLTMTGPTTPPRATAETEVGLAERVMPDIAVAIDPADLVDIAWIEQLTPNQIWLRLDCADPALAATLAAARALGRALTLDVLIDGHDPARELAEIAGAGLEPARVVVVARRNLKTRPSNTHPPGEASEEQIAQAARAAFPGARVGGGVRGNFTELNRNRPHLPTIEIIAHATSAVVHAADDRSVMETLEGLAHVVAAVRALASNALYHLGPCTIGMADNPYGDAPAPNPNRTRVAAARFDPRHFALFGAAWAVGVLDVAARGGVSALSLGHATGDLGLTTPATTPLGLVAKLAATAAGRRRLRTGSTPGLASVAWTGARGLEMLVANLGLEPRSWPVPLAADVRVLEPIEDAWNWRKVDTSGLVLGSYAVASVLQ